MKIIYISLLFLVLISCRDTKTTVSNQNNSDTLTLKSEVNEEPDTLSLKGKNSADVAEKTKVNSTKIKEKDSVIKQDRDAVDKIEIKQKQNKETPKDNFDQIEVTEKIKNDEKIIKPDPMKQNNKIPPVIAKEENKNDFELWDLFLRKYVSLDGRVNYKQIKNNYQDLTNCLDVFSNIEITKMNKSSQKAFWMNVYNAFTIKKVLDQYPVKSIQDIDGGKPWDQKFIKIKNETFSLNQIENEVIRPKFKDARIHFGINCAAKSCPPLSNIAFTEKNIESQLEKLTREFLDNPSFNTISSNPEISKIFDWYSADFVDVYEFINQYSKIKIVGNPALRYKQYNWNLNN